MSNSRKQTKRTRRQFLKVGAGVAGAGLSALAGCSQPDSDDGGDGGNGDGGSDGGDSGDGGGMPDHDSVPMFRKNIQRTGYVPDVTVPDSVQLDWRERGVNKWTHTAAKGSPTIHDDDIFVGGDTGAVYSFTMDGEVRWGSATHPSSKGVHGTPAVVDDTVYIGAYDGAMYAYSRDDGSLKWRTKIGDAIGSSPAYYDGKIYVSVETYEPSGIMSILDAETGEILWEDHRVSNHPHSSVALDPDTGVMTVGANDGFLYGWDMEENEFIWKFGVNGTKDLDRSRPIKGPIAVHDGAAFFGSWDHYVYRVDLETGETDWEFEADNFVMSGPGVDPRTSRVYIGSHDDNLYCLDVDNGDEVWSFETDGIITGCPVITEEKVLVGSYDHHLYAVDRNTGDKVWDYEGDGWVTSSPAVKNGKVAFTDRADINQPNRTPKNYPGSLFVLTG